MKSSSLPGQELMKESVFPVAARAAAIYIGNRQKQLPPVYFHIVFNKLAGVNIENPYSNYFFKMEGGQLIHNVLLFNQENTRYFSGLQRLTYELALEADIVNLLVGPMARIKYRALRERATVNRSLCRQNLPGIFGNPTELEVLNEYLDCFSGNEAAREKSANELFLKAMNFIDQQSNWLAITGLAHYLLGHDKSIFACDEIIDVLQTFLPAGKDEKMADARRLQAV